MYYLHTPSKHGRTVVIFIKKIWALVLSHAQASFCPPKAKRPMVSGHWLPPEEGFLRLGGDLISVVIRPAAHHGPPCLFNGVHRPLELQINKLEVVVPLVNHVVDIYDIKSKIIIINLSQVSSTPEQVCNFNNKKAIKSHNYIYEELIIRLHKIGHDVDCEIIIFEQKELLSKKNSALFERLFISKQ
jgi:hypothetical protein